MFIVGTLTVVAVAFWLLVYRYTGRLDSNVPLLFHLMIGFHMLTWEDGLNPYLVYLGLVCALFLRFEFMSRGFVRFVQIIETIPLAYVIWRGVGLFVS
jgi:hypothetical protein